MTSWFLGKIEVVKIMIADDNVRLRRLVREMLRDLSAGVVDCADGDEVMALYREERPDWVLMDIEMPRVDGLIATRWLTTAFPAAKVVMLTHHDSPQFRREARAAGAVGYLLKEDLGAARSLARGLTEAFLPAEARQRPAGGEARIVAGETSGQTKV